MFPEAWVNGMFGNYDWRHSGRRRKWINCISSNVNLSDDANAQAMVASFCGRSFDDGETNEIAQRIGRATANINVEIETLLEFLAHKGDS